MTNTKPQDVPEAPAKITKLHVQSRAFRGDDGQVDAQKGWRRIDRLDWLKSHGTIAEHQFQAGRRLQADWQMAKIEQSPRSGGTGGGSARSTLSDAALDAGARLGKALAVLPQELETLLTLFLLPEDHPFSLERCAAMVREDRRAAAYGIRIGLTLLSRHYGFCG